MRLTLRGKLFLVLLFITGAVVAGMLAVMQWSFERGFVSLVEARQQAQVKAVTTRLADEYAAAGGWQRLRGDRARWAQLLFSSRPGGADRSPRWVGRPLPGPPHQWPPHRGRAGAPEGQRGDSRHAGHARAAPLEFRLMLLDADRHLLFGEAARLADAELKPVIAAGATVGWLAVLPGPAIDELADIRFVARQRQTFVVIAAAMVLLAAALALPLAGAMTRRVREITGAARALASGHFDTRVAVTSGDELGQLARDVNELAKALARTEQGRRQWVADISHELRTPLAVLRGELEALQDGVRPLTMAAIDSLHADTLRLHRLVDDLNDLAMSDLGALSYRKTAVEPLAILREDLAALAGEFTDRQIDVTLEPTAGPSLRINGDSGRLSQLFRNLLTNTLRYTDVGGRLVIRVTRSGDQLQMAFSDTAPGVPADDLPRLFDRFHRVDASRNRASGGAGLGLAICRSIVEAHDGSITATASALGGLSVLIDLPLLP